WQIVRAHTGREVAYEWIPATGAARARNVGIGLARAPIMVLIGSDILIEPAFLEAHLRFHREHPEENAAAIGQTRWSNAQPRTPYARWLEEQGVQFGYGLIRDGGEVDYHFFYTSNLSMKTSLAKRYPFDERFPGAGLEDIELG